MRSHEPVKFSVNGKPVSFFRPQRRPIPAAGLRAEDDATHEPSD